MLEIESITKVPSSSLVKSPPASYAISAPFRDAALFSFHLHAGPAD